ncbi:MAG: hypothetical protein NTW62_00405 [Candidatus Nomurabacteria bacterium]|nr:hypothetical protein [Candidatus Nomurabacteria bacterium]
MSTNKFVSVAHQQLPAKGSLNYLRLEAQKSYTLFKRDSVLYDSICSEKKQMKRDIADAKMLQETDRLFVLKSSYINTYIASKEIHRKVKISVRRANFDQKKLSRELNKSDSFTLIGALRKMING